MMASACRPGSGGVLPIGDLLALTDCRAGALGAGGYQALAGGGWFAAILTGLLTVAVAAQGYRMLTGRVPDLHQGLSMAVRIGLAIALSGSTAAYGTLVYRVATEGPFEVSARLTRAAGLVAGDLPGRLDRLYTAIRLDPETRGRLTADRPGGAPTAPAMTGDAAQRNAAIMFVVVSVGPWLAVRFAMALLLAAGPLAATLLLFDATLGVFRNWVRAVGGSAIALTGLAVAIPLELEALEPVVALAGVGTPDFIAIAGILGVFAVVSGAILFAAARITAVVPLPRSRAAPASVAVAVASSTVSPRDVVQPPVVIAAQPGSGSTTGAQRSHAASVTNALANAARRGGPASVTIDGARSDTAPRPIGIAARPAPALPIPAGPASARRIMPTLRQPSDRTPHR